MLTSLPTPPTDNLYKFMAVVGLIAILASVIYPRLRLESMDDLQAEAASKAAEVSDLQEKMVADAKNLQAAIDADIAAGGPKAKIVDIKASPSTVSQAAILQEASVDETIRLSELNKMTFKLKSGFDRYKQWRDFCDLVFGVGLIMSLLGFVMWFRSQRLQDKMLLKQAIGDPSAK